MTKEENKKANQLIAVLLIALTIVIVTGAYKRPWMPGGPFYEAPATPAEAKNEPQTLEEAPKVEIPEKEPNQPPAKDQVAKTRVVGIASWYDYTIGGENWSESHNTCASRTLKRYTMARVTNIETGESVECYVNDYIEHPDREIDLSSHAFAQIAPLDLGLVKVIIEQL